MGIDTFRGIDTFDASGRGGEVVGPAPEMGDTLGGSPVGRFALVGSELVMSLPIEDLEGLQAYHATGGAEATAA